MKFDKKTRKLAIGISLILLLSVSIIPASFFSSFWSVFTGKIISESDSTSGYNPNVNYHGCYRTDNSDVNKKGKLCLYEDVTNKEVCIEDYCGKGAGSLNQYECVSESEFKENWIGCLSGCKNGACILKD